MEYYIFKDNVAKLVGSDAAALFQNIGHWVTVNRVNQKNFKNGKYWMYNTAQAWQELFTYLSVRQIRYALEKLQESGLIESGCFNSDKYDHTKWYTLTQTGETLFSAPVAKAEGGGSEVATKDLQKQELEVTKSEALARASNHSPIKVPIEIPREIRSKSARTHAPAHAQEGESASPGAPGGYPQSAAEVLEIASDPRCGMPCTFEQADEYFTVRASRDWVDAARRQISPGRVYLDLKCWLMGKRNGRIRPYDNGPYDNSGDDSGWLREKEANDRLWAARRCDDNGDKHE